jgi:hypothetical protein
MVFNTTYNNISVISWWSVALVEYPEKANGLPQDTNKLYRILLHRVHLTWGEFEFTTSVVISGTDCIGNCESNRDTITTTMVPMLYIYIVWHHHWLRVKNKFSEICNRKVSCCYYGMIYSILAMDGFEKLQNQSFHWTIMSWYCTVLVDY